MTASGPSVDYGLPCLAAEVSFWQSAFGLDDWTIKARHVDDLRCPRNARERILGLVNACSPDTRTAEVHVRTPRTAAFLAVWREIVCHEMMHVLHARHRGPGWTMAKEHAVIEAAAPILARLKKRDPVAAARVGAEVARAVREAWPLVSPAPACDASKAAMSCGAATEPRPGNHRSTPR